MQKLPASIFNDVIGPVMRGPSSSHVAGAARIGSLVRQSMNNQISEVLVEFDPNGSLAESYHGHGSDIGFVSGLLDLALTDPRVPEACEIAEQKGLKVKFVIIDYAATHPNNYRMTATDNKGFSLLWEAISVGGGMVEMTSLNGLPVNIGGGFYELVALCSGSLEDLERIKKETAGILEEFEEISSVGEANKGLVNIKLSREADRDKLDRLQEIQGVSRILEMHPILPTQSIANCVVPFTTAESLEKYAEKDKRQLWQLAAHYEAVRGNSTEEDVFRKMDELLAIMELAADDGLAGTSYEDRILGAQAKLMHQKQQGGTLLPNDLITNITKYITAIMEVKSSMGVIVAAPTAGSCGGLPGTIIGLGRTLGLPREEMVKGMLVAGLIGVFIAESATFAAEVAGCQVECGAGSGMAAAGITQMLGGTVVQCLDAASMALQNITGLACDPVANRVEVPCLGKNVMAGMNALASANMVLAGFDKVIPLDQTIAAIYDIGLKLPLELRCTFGGLGKTPASMKIRERLS